MNAQEFIPSALLAVLLGLLAYRRVYTGLPYFCAYVLFAVAADIARFATRSHQPLYFATYWITEAVYDALGMLVMYEVLHTILGTLARAPWRRVIFPGIVLAGLIAGIARADAVPSRLSGVTLYIVTGEIAVRFVQVFVFAGLVTLVPVLGLRWRQYSFGVATGFGLYATVMLLTTVKFSDFGTRFTFLWGVTSLVAYSLTVVIWIWFFSAPQKVEPPSSGLSVVSSADLNRYKDALRRMR